MALSFGVTVLPDPPIGLAQKCHVDVVGEAGEHQRRPMPRQCRYPFEFRGDGIGTRCSRHLSLQRFRVARLPLPSTGSFGSCFPGLRGTTRSSDFLPCLPSRFVAFAWRYRPVLAHSFHAEAEHGFRGPGLGLGVAHPRTPDGHGRISQVPGGPSAACPAL